jgi:hypothetical protein
MKLIGEMWKTEKDVRGREDGSLIEGIAVTLGKLAISK